MQEKQIDFKSVEMLQNIQIDINSIIIQQGIKKLDKLNSEAIDTITAIQKEINKTLAEYINYILTK
jgi:hypothetical protein|nr:MAG TPA: hypothetical protein [Caudoviricetes sp.]